MKAYLTAMLGNDQTLDWEEWLPALMFSYNTQVHKSTMESPFFLTVMSCQTRSLSLNLLLLLLLLW